MQDEIEADPYGPAINFGSGMAGVFMQKAAPLADGVYSYEPLRSIDHLQLHEAIDRGERPLCWSSDGDQKIEYRVVACEEYGRLRLEDIRVKASGDAS